MNNYFLNKALITKCKYTIYRSKVDKKINYNLSSFQLHAWRSSDAIIKCYRYPYKYSDVIKLTVLRIIKITYRKYVVNSKDISWNKSIRNIIECIKFQWMLLWNNALIINRIVFTFVLAFRCHFISFSQQYSFGKKTLVLLCEAYIINVSLGQASMI